MPNLNSVIAAVIQFVSGTMITFSQGDATKIKTKRFSDFGSRTIQSEKNIGKSVIDTG